MSDVSLFYSWIKCRCVIISFRLKLICPKGKGKKAQDSRGSWLSRSSRTLSFAGVRTKEAYSSHWSEEEKGDLTAVSVTSGSERQLSFCLGSFTLRSHLSHKCDWLKLSITLDRLLFYEPICCKPLRKTHPTSHELRKTPAPSVLISVTGWPEGETIVFGLDSWQPKHTRSSYIRTSSRPQNPFKAETLNWDIKNKTRI